MTQRASEMQVLVIRGRRTSRLFLARERSRGLILHESFRDRVADFKAKASSWLLASQDR